MMSFHAFGVILMTAVFLGAIVQGFSGFAFSAVAGAILLQVQAPGVAIPLLMICSLLIQTFVLVRLRAALSLHGSLPYLVGGAGGVVLATLVFDRLDPHVFRQCFGAFLMVYALSTVLRPKSALLMVKARPVGHTAVGFAGGLVGGLTAMPGAVLAIWCDAHAMPKIAQRAVVQPFIAAVQSLALVFLFLKAPGAPVAVLHHLRHRVARVMVMRSLATLALAALLALQASASHAQALDKPDPAVSAWLPGCRAFLQNTETMGSEGAGQCAGAVDALLYIGELLPADFRYCVPLRTPRGEIIATILDDIEAMRPEVDRQDFKGMVLSILQFHWPCRE